VVFSLFYINFLNNLLSLPTDKWRLEAEAEAEVEVEVEAEVTKKKRDCSENLFTL